MTNDQDAIRLNWLGDTIERTLSDDASGFMYRPFKLREQFDRYEIDFMDVLFALENRTRSVMCEGPGERFQVTGPSIDGDEAKIILTAKGESDLKIVNVWIKE